MNRRSLELGRLIQAFRVEKRLTQKELAQAAGCSRTAVALMEQGRRLLDPSSLRAVAVLLGIPERIVAPFTTPPMQHNRNARPTQLTPRPPFNMLCISGVSGAGKTTLARVVARSYGVRSLGSASIGKAYLEDLTADRNRWAFETQVAFLVSKAQAIKELLEGGESIVVERSIGEDISVYERLFAQDGSIKERSQATFEIISTVATSMVPPPEYVIYLTCSVQTALERTQSRARDDAPLHDAGYLETTLKLYDEWLDSLIGPEVYTINTDATDLARPGILEAVFNEIRWVLSHDVRNPQVSLFPDGEPWPRGLAHLRPYKPERWTPLQKTLAGASAQPVMSPIAYLAAPFTGQDTEMPPHHDHGQRSLFDPGIAHGMIPRSGFRQELLGLERSLRSMGFNVVLPHRDINEWGRKTLAPGDAMKACTESVGNADLFVGVLGASCGAHYEFGLAHAAGKPCILVRVGDMPSSFLADGAAILASADLLEITAPSLREAAASIESDDRVQVFVRRHFGARP